MLSKQARNALLGWESHRSRITKASFKTNKEGITMGVIKRYTPTNDSKDDGKDQFYKRLQSIIEKCPGKDLTMLTGNLNAKVRMDNNDYEGIMERHELREKYENGERFANLCAFNNSTESTRHPIDVTPPAIEEIKMAIRQIKSGKAAGPDNIPAEALKSDIEVTASMIHTLFGKIWEEERVSMTDWKEEYLIKIPKKGDLSKCEN
ncbi:unnamed protein product [Schistosoma mattheei]|uniref:Uncharacterized protein n=1 Tax=Schistosoma mattheei TaxID=31246 RepID=A0A183NWH0_9TREM|nr:unnamed protein product [Schistosoma mattheei]